MSETTLVNLEFGKNLQATKTHPSTINNKVSNFQKKLFCFLNYPVQNVDLSFTSFLLKGLINIYI